MTNLSGWSQNSQFVTKLDFEGDCLPVSSNDFAIFIVKLLGQLGRCKKEFGAKPSLSHSLLFLLFFTSLTLGSGLLLLISLYQALLSFVFASLAEESAIKKEIAAYTAQTLFSSLNWGYGRDANRLSWTRILVECYEVARFQ